MRASFFEQLEEAASTNESFLCGGLDPDYKRVPQELRMARAPSDAVMEFLRGVIETTSSYVCAYKLQRAFFDVMNNSERCLRETIAYIRVVNPRIPIITDAKIGDTGNTMQAYLQYFFRQLDVDAIVVNPYMGEEVLSPFRTSGGRGGIVLVQTSNSGAAIVQEQMMMNGKRLWQYMLDLVVSEWRTGSQLMPVLASTTPSIDDRVLEFLPENIPVFIAGFGAQGGRLDIVTRLMSNRKRVVVVNSSREIVYASENNDVSVDWRDAVLKATLHARARVRQASQ